MQYDDLVRDFAARTRRNLEVFRSLQHERPELKFYEVTQLINSMLGLLVFPQQGYIERIPKTPIEQLRRDGWPIPEVVGDYPQVADLNQLVRYLRNAIAHCNIRFLDHGAEICGLELWNVPPGASVNWRATLTIGDVERIAVKFTELLLGAGSTER